MTEHMKWLNTKDGMPTFKEVRGKRVDFVLKAARSFETGYEGFTVNDQSDYSVIFKECLVDWYIIIDPPEEEPLEYKGNIPEISTTDTGDELLAWESDAENGITTEIRFYAPTRSAVITAWNQFVRSIKETK